MECADEDALIDELKHVGTDQLSNVAVKDWESGLRHRKITSVTALIRPLFKKREKAEDVAHENWVSQLENILRLSNSEGCQYDFKQGLYDLGEKKKFLKDALSEYIRTLTAEVNKGPYGGDYKQFIDTKFYITGIQGEINTYLKGNDDSYGRIIRSQIKEEPVDEYTKQYILTHMKFVSYYGKTILVLELESSNSPISYADKFYERQNNETTLIDGASSTLALMQRFSK